MTMEELEQMKRVVKKEWPTLVEAMRKLRLENYNYLKDKKKFVQKPTEQDTLDYVAAAFLAADKIFGTYNKKIFKVNGTRVSPGVLLLAISGQESSFGISMGQSYVQTGRTAEKMAYGPIQVYWRAHKDWLTRLKNIKYRSEADLLRYRHGFLAGAIEINSRMLRNKDKLDSALRQYSGSATDYVPRVCSKLETIKIAMEKIKDGRTELADARNGKG